MQFLDALDANFEEGDERLIRPLATKINGPR